MKIVYCALLFLFDAQVARAGENLYSDSYDTCNDQSGGVTLEIMNCTAAEEARQDKRLNEAYRSLLAELSDERKRELKAAQRLWIQFRDANCQFYADPEGGSSAGMAAASCHLEMTATRAEELEDLSH